MPHPINKALHRPGLIVGVEALPLLVLVIPPIATGGFSLMFGGYVGGPILMLIGLAFWFGLKQANKHDPHMFAIFARAALRKKVYPPRTSAFAKR